MWFSPGYSNIIKKDLYINVKLIPVKVYFLRKKKTSEKTSGNRNREIKKDFKALGVNLKNINKMEEKTN